VSVLVVTAVAPERDAVLRDVPSDADVEAVVCGVGPVAAATATAADLAVHPRKLVVSAGICGGFDGRAAVGDVVVATSAVAADLGCRTDEGLLTLADLGLDQDDRAQLAVSAAWADRLAAAGLVVRTGEMLTLSCMTGTDVDGKALADRHPDAVAEAMEGWGVAWAGRYFGVQTAEIRAVSNIIGRRDPTTWDIAGAFDALARACAIVLTGPLP
jgi:futalosine hydrolase